MGDSSERRQEQHSEDSVLVSIAQKPLLVAVIFLLTAFLPWTLCWIVPTIANSFQSTSLQDLFQWFTLPLLFALVNFSIFYLWMNSAGRHSVRFQQQQQQQQQHLHHELEVPNVQQERDLGDFKLGSRRHSARFQQQQQQQHLHHEFEVPNVQQERDLGDFKLGSCRQEDEDFAPAVAEARNQQRHSYLDESGGGGGGIESQSSEASEISSRISDLAIGDAPLKALLERGNKGHHKSRSLTNGILRIVPPAAPMEEPESSQPHSKRPKSKTPGAVLGSRRAERNRAFDIDPKVLDSLDTSRHIVARRNSSPKSTAAPPQQEDQEQQQQQQGDGEEQQQQALSKSTSSPSYVYGPQVREREPIPLDKDDLNTRIEDFLTRFKMQRQESNLKALVS